MYTKDHPKFIVSNHQEEPISIQRVNAHSGPVMMLSVSITFPC